MTETTSEIVRRSRTRATRHEHIPSPEPRLRLAIVTCMDARIESGAAFGLQAGDAHVIRNAGGVVTGDVIRSLAISQAALNTREIMVVQHTDCGLGRFDEATLREKIDQVSGAWPTFALETFRDLEASVRAGCARIRETKVIAHRDQVRGFVYEVETGLLREVDG